MELFLSFPTSAFAVLLIIIYLWDSLIAGEHKTLDSNTSLTLPVTEWLKSNQGKPPFFLDLVLIYSVFKSTEPNKSFKLLKRPWATSFFTKVYILEAFYRLIMKNILKKETHYSTTDPNIKKLSLQFCSLWLLRYFFSSLCPHLIKILIGSADSSSIFPVLSLELTLYFPGTSQGLHSVQGQDFPSHTHTHTFWGLLLASYILTET